MEMEEPQCHPDTADRLHKRRTVVRPVGRCPPPGAGESTFHQCGVTDELLRGPYSPFATTSRPGLVLSTSKHACINMEGNKAAHLDFSKSPSK